MQTLKKYRSIISVSESKAGGKINKGQIRTVADTKYSEVRQDRVPVECYSIIFAITPIEQFHENMSNYVVVSMFVWLYI